MRLSETITMSHNSLQIPAVGNLIAFQYNFNDIIAMATQVYHNSCPWNSAQTHLKEMSIRKVSEG